MTTLLVPLTRFEVDFEVASGRPYSDLDVFVLRAVKDGATSIPQLTELFRLPARLLIEVLVTLARAGWVAISTTLGSPLSITPQGVVALDSKEIPEFLTIKRESTKIIMECLTGMLVQERSMGTSYDPEWKLEQDGTLKTAHKLDAQFFDDRLDEGHIKGLLSLARSDSNSWPQWIRWISPPRLISRQSHWLKVYVDGNQKLVGIPEQWRFLFEGVLLQEASAYLPKQVTMKTVVPHPEQSRQLATSYRTSILPEDILLTNRQHREKLQAVLKQAKSTVLIGSAFFSMDTFESLRVDLLSALQRGVHIDLLWGFKAGSEDGELDKSAKNLINDVRKQTPNGKLRFNQSPSDSHAKVLIYDTATDEYEAYIGSYNWLSAVGTGDSIGENVSVRVTHPAVLADLSRSLAGLWLAGASNRFSDGPDRWRHLAERFEQTAALMPVEEQQVGNCYVTVLRDQQHDQLMRQHLLSSNRRCLVASHKVGVSADIRLAPLEKRSFENDFGLHIFHGNVLEIPTEQYVALVSNLKKATPVVIHEQAGLHSKLLVSDDAVIISSYNFLSADPFGRARNSREIGILIEGAPIADFIWDSMTMKKNGARSL